MEKQARCAKCGEFDSLDKMVVLECPSCKYRTFRHKGAEECAGMDGAMRSIRAHFNYYFKRAGGDGGHVAAIARMSRIVAPRIVAALTGTKRKNT